MGRTFSNTRKRARTFFMIIITDSIRTSVYIESNANDKWHRQKTITKVTGRPSSYCVWRRD